MRNALIVALLHAAFVLIAAAQQRVPARVEISPSPLYFGSVGLATAATRPVTLTNVGPTPLTIASGYPVILGNQANDFAITDNDCGGYVPPGRRCTIKITFTPVVRGTRSAFLKFIDDGDASPRILNLTGVGH